MNKIAILCFALVMILCGCTSSMDYSDEVTDGPWTAVISGEGGSAFVVSYLWDGTKEGLRLEPNTVSGCFVTGFGGYMGRGLPMPFYLDIPGVSGGKHARFTVNSDDSWIDKKESRNVWKDYSLYDELRADEMGNLGLGLFPSAQILRAHKARFGCDAYANGTELWFEMKTVK